MPPRWLVFSLLTILSWGIWALIAVPLAHLSAPQSQAFSTLGVLPLLLAALPAARRRGGARERQGAALAFAAGIVSGLGNLGYYKAVAAGAKASVAVSLTALYPLATILLAFTLLRERPGRAQAAGIAAALPAIYLLNAQQEATGPGVLTPWSLYALAPICLWGTAALLSKLAADRTRPEAAVFWYLAASLPLAAGLLATEPMAWSLSGRDWALLACLGFTLGLGNLTVLEAYRSAGKASIVTPLAGLYPAIAIPLSIILFHEEVAALQWAGIGLALLAAILLALEPAAAPASPRASPSPGTPT